MAKNAPICTVRKAVWTTGEDQFLSGQIDILMTDRHERWNVIYSTQVRLGYWKAPTECLELSPPPSLQELQSLKSVLLAISSCSSLCTVITGHKVTCHGAQIPLASSFAPGCHPFTCFWLLVELPTRYLGSLGCTASGNSSLFFTFLFPKVKKSLKQDWQNSIRFLVGRRLLFLQHSPCLSWYLSFFTLYTTFSFPSQGYSVSQWCPDCVVPRIS